MQADHSDEESVDLSPMSDFCDMHIPTVSIIPAGWADKLTVISPPEKAQKVTVISPHGKAQKVTVISPPGKEDNSDIPSPSNADSGNR